MAELTVIGRMVHRSMIHHRRGASINRLQVRSALTLENIMWLIVEELKTTVARVPRNFALAWLHFQICLPDMMVRVDRAGGNDLVLAIDDPYV